MIVTDVSISRALERVQALGAVARLVLGSTGACPLLVVPRVDAGR